MVCTIDPKMLGCLTVNEDIYMTLGHLYQTIYNICCITLLYLCSKYDEQSKQQFYYFYRDNKTRRPTNNYS